jgi:hypothetical protein
MINIDHADGNVQCRGIDASDEAIGDDSNAICLNASHASHASHGVAQAAIHSHVVPRGLELSMSRMRML